jgi:hypothetical protein
MSSPPVEILNDDDHTIRSFELYIKVLSNTNITSSSTSDSGFRDSKQFNLSSLTQIVANSNKSKILRLNFDSTMSFIEIKRKLAILTQTYASNQEWYIYKLNQDFNSCSSQKSSTKTSTDYLNELADSLDATSATIETLIEQDKIYSIPLTLIIEERTNLDEICMFLDDLIKQASSKVALSSHIKDKNAIRMFFVCINKEQTNGLMMMNGNIEDDVSEILNEHENGSSQLKHRLSSIDLTKQDSVEEIDYTPLSQKTKTENNNSINKHDNENENDHYFVVDDDDEDFPIEHHDDDEDVHFLEEETQRPKKQKGMNKLAFFL